MNLPKNELIAVLQEFNPWWNGRASTDLPDWERSAMGPLRDWMADTESRRALVLTGARQTGKTTLLRQAVRHLLEDRPAAGNILYATFDHPILKLAGLERTLAAWEEMFPPEPDEPQWLFLDEIQYVAEWQTWLKHQVDFKRGRRIVVTGSASPLGAAKAESGVGRWQTLPLATLSFGEFLKLRNIDPGPVPLVKSLKQCFDWSEGDFARTAGLAKGLTPHFHDYLLRGGFPEPAMVSDLSRCQRLLREDIVDKVLKRDMTALYGVRRVLEVEKIFLYLCYHDGGIVDVAALSRELDGVNRNSVNNFLDLFESTHLVYRLRPHGYGKEVLRGKPKLYLADAALPGSVLLLGRKLLERADRLGAAVETAFFKHVFTRYYADQPSFTYWRDKTNKDLEVDLIASIGERLVPFEVKYQDAAPEMSKLKGLRHFLEDQKVEQGYVITRRWEDFGIRQVPSAKTGRERVLLDSRILSIPAPLACYWLSS